MALMVCNFKILKGVILIFLLGVLLTNCSKRIEGLNKHVCEKNTFFDDKQQHIFQFYGLRPQVNIDKKLSVNQTINLKNYIFESINAEAEEEYISSAFFKHLTSLPNIIYKQKKRIYDSKKTWIDKFKEGSQINYQYVPVQYKKFHQYTEENNIVLFPIFRYHSPSNSQPGSLYIEILLFSNNIVLLHKTYVLHFLYSDKHTFMKNTALKILCQTLIDDIYE
jgi:hypothetical protein